MCEHKNIITGTQWDHCRDCGKITGGRLVQEYMVELEAGLWVAHCDGRTKKMESAAVFFSEEQALEGLKSARAFRPFPNATVERRI